MLSIACAVVPGHVVDNLEEAEPNSLVATIELRVGAQTVRAPSWVPARGWSANEKGYINYTSRGKRHGIKRGTKLHRYVVSKIANRPLEAHEVIHHMDFNKRNNCPCNLLLTTAEFNPSCALRDPYTGAFMTAGEYERRYGKPTSSVPDWVSKEF